MPPPSASSGGRTRHALATLSPPRLQPTTDHLPPPPSPAPAPAPRLSPVPAAPPPAAAPRPQQQPALPPAEAPTRALLPELRYSSAVDLVQRLLQLALDSRATDIHIEPAERGARIRFR